MNESVRIEKNNSIKEHGKETRARHASMRPFCVELKLDLKCLSKAEQEKLWHYFTQCRWLCNYLISLDADAFKSFDTKTRGITSLDKDGNSVDRCLTMPAKFIQSVYSSLKQDMATLAANPNVLVIDRFFPSTRMCPRCGAINEGITLSERIFACGCGYTEERKSDFDTSYEIWKHSAKRPEKGKSPEAPFSKR